MDLLHHRPSARGFFITGSDTEVGKTWVACALIRTLRKHFVRVGAYKPVASGAESLEQSDGYQLWQATGELESFEMVSPQTFQAAVAPPIAAELEGKRIDRELIEQRYRLWQDRCDFLIVEGAGGLFSPIDFDFTNADLAERIGYPIIVVVNNRLGAVNQALMALKSARLHGLDVAAIVLNQTKDQPMGALQSDNRMMLERLILGNPTSTPLVISFSYRQANWLEQPT